MYYNQSDVINQTMYKRNFIMLQMESPPMTK